MTLELIPPRRPSSMERQRLGQTNSVTFSSLGKRDVLHIALTVCGPLHSFQSGRSLFLSIPQRLAKAVTTRLQTRLVDTHMLQALQQRDVCE
jgi:hypothetical protein